MTSAPTSERRPKRSSDPPLSVELPAPTSQHAVLVRHIDGDSTVVKRDTLDQMLLLPDGVELHLIGRQTVEVRYAGINAPEIATSAGRDALAYLQTILPLSFQVVTINERTEKYGRLLAWLVLPDGRCVNRLMVDSGHAVAFGDLPIDPP